MGSNLAFSVPVSWKVSIDFFDFSGSLFVHKDFLGALSRYSVSLPAPSLFKVNLAWKITFFFYLLEFKRGPIFVAPGCPLELNLWMILISLFLTTFVLLIILLSTIEL